MSLRPESAVSPRRVSRDEMHIAAHKSDMVTEVFITARYQADADTVFAQALHLAEMKDAMSGIATYKGLPDGVVTQGDEFRVDVTLWGFLKTKGHVIKVETLDKTARILQSREHNPSVKHWDHTLSVQPSESGCLWTDRVIIDAGWNTFGTALFAKYVYSKRHRHRNALNATAELRKL